MRFNTNSSEEQPTQELNLNAQTASHSSVEQQTARLGDIAHQMLDQQHIEDRNTELLSIVPGAVEQHKHEQLPTHEVSLEQHVTLPLASEQANFKRPSIDPKVAEKEMYKQGALLPAEKQQGRRIYTSLLMWVPMLFFVFLLIFVLSARSAIETWVSNEFANKQTSSRVVPVNHLQPSPIQPSLIDHTATLFMKAMLRKDWSSMWPMLSPDTQQLWQGEKDFIHFEQAKFGPLHLTSFNDSSAQMYHTWIDPDTTQVYSDVEVLHISLGASATLGQLSTPSNQALNKGLFHNTLFTLVQYQFKWRVLFAGPADLDAPVLIPASPPARRLLVPIFMYHNVSDLVAKNYLDYSLTVTTPNFNAQLDWLQQHGYHSITQTELFDALYYGKVLPTHPMILTFDDGYENVFTNALPALLAHHYRGVFNIITGKIGGNYMTWPQVRELAKDGMQVASHTIHHVNVGQPPAWTSIQNELLVSKETLEDQLQQPVQFFCYPAGEPFHQDSVYEQQIVLADLAQDGYVAATLDPFFYDSVIQNARIPYQLPRIRVSGGESLQLFTSTLNSTLFIDAYRMANGLPY